MRLMENKNQNYPQKLAERNKESVSCSLKMEDKFWLKEINDNIKEK